jgi:hypothetical protein
MHCLFLDALLRQINTQCKKHARCEVFFPCSPFLITFQQSELLGEQPEAAKYNLVIVDSQTGLKKHVNAAKDCNTNIWMHCLDRQYTMQEACKM